MDYLDLPITVLRNKQEAARAEIQRLMALESEEVDITRQLAALTQARAAFAPGEATTSSDTGGTVPVDAPDEAMKTFEHHNAVALSDLHNVDVVSKPVKQRRSRPKKGAETNVPVETKQVEPVPSKSRLSDEGRKRIVEATKRFWAAKRRAARQYRARVRPKAVWLPRRKRYSVGELLVSCELQDRGELCRGQVGRGWMKVRQELPD